MENITIENFELTDNDLFYSGYVYGNYFSNLITSDTALFDQIKKEVNTKYYCIKSIIESLLYAEFVAYKY